MDKNLEVSLLPYDRQSPTFEYDLDGAICDLNSQLDLLTASADTADYLVSAASGILCGMLDVLWVGEFNLERGKKIANDRVEGLVKKTAKLLGCEKNDLESSVRFLEKKFPLASDGNTPNLGGGLQHHLRDFAHHPTIVGLVFSLLTQFTEKAYGTNTEGRFIIVDVAEHSKIFIGKDTPTKILYGTLVWFFHLVSDMAGSGSTAGKSGGTGIPGPILSLAKELSVLPFFRDITVGENSLSVFLSKLFNGTLLAQHDENGKIIKDTVLRFDLRAELGVAIELGRQALPVIANECLVRGFYFARRLGTELKNHHVRSFRDFRKVDWQNVKPANNPTIVRMLTIATGVFTAIDVGEAAISKKWVSINYIGVGRFAVAIGEDVCWGLKSRKVKEIKSMYETIRSNVYRKTVQDGLDGFGLSLEQIEILYNIEYHTVLNDISITQLPAVGNDVKALKSSWLEEWQSYLASGYEEFTQVPGAQLHWYSKEELLQHIETLEPNGVWFRLALLEAMLFTPYFPLSLDTDKKGNPVPSKKYALLHNPISGFNRSEADKYLDTLFPESYYSTGYIKRLKKCHSAALRELNEVLKIVIRSAVIATAFTLATALTVGAAAPSIAVAMVGSKFAGLGGAALTNACLAYLGGGAIAAGGMGMAGGTIALVGGGAMLGLGLGAGVGGAANAAGIIGKEAAVAQSAKLIVATREIFLNDEHDLAYSEKICEQYLQRIKEIESGLADLRLEHDIAKGKDKKLLNAKIKEAKQTADAMRIARKSLVRYHSSFELGLAANDK